MTYTKKSNLILLLVANLLLLAVVERIPVSSAFARAPAIAVADERKVAAPSRVTATTTMTALHLWPFRMSSSEYNNRDDSGGQHLIRAGQELHAAAKSVGPSNYACPHLLKDVGDSISEIGEYWTQSWEAVTYAAEDAAQAMAQLAQLQSHAELAKLYSASSGELGEIARIVGCTSVGPPTAVPNLEGLSQKLREAAIYVEKCGDECSEDSRSFGISLRNASKSIKALAKEYN